METMVQNDKTVLFLVNNNFTTVGQIKNTFQGVDLSILSQQSRQDNNQDKKYRGVHKSFISLKNSQKEPAQFLGILGHARQRSNYTSVRGQNSHNLKYGTLLSSVVEAVSCVAASGTGSLGSTDDGTAAKSRKMNSVVYRAVFLHRFSQILQGPLDVASLCRGPTKGNCENNPRLCSAIGKPSGSLGSY